MPALGVGKIAVQPAKFIVRAVFAKHFESFARSRFNQRADDQTIEQLVRPAASADKPMTQRFGANEAVSRAVVMRPAPKSIALRDRALRKKSST